MSADWIVRHRGTNLPLRGGYGTQAARLYMTEDQARGALNRAALPREDRVEYYEIVEVFTR